MLCLSFDSQSTNQQYMTLTVVPAVNDSNSKKTVGESVDDSVGKLPGLVALPQKEEPRHAFARRGSHAPNPLIRAIYRADPQAFQPGSAPETRIDGPEARAIEPNRASLVP
jgi:hypothetical protein